MMTMNTVSGNVGVATVNPQITLALGDNDTGLKWNSDGNFSLYTDNNERVKIDPAGDVTINNRLCLSGVCQNVWPSGTDSQTLSIAGSNLSISGGNTVTLPDGAGSQTLSMVGSNL